MKLTFFAFFVGFFALVVSHQCIHDSLTKTVKKESTAIYGQDGKRNLNRDYIRIFANTDTAVYQGQPDSGYTCYSAGQTVSTVGGYLYCQSENLLTSAKSDYIINDLLPAAIAKFEATLKVQRVEGNLVLPANLENCFPSNVPLPVPASYRNQGVADTDVVVFVTARPVGISNVLAFGGDCASDSTTKRSIAGYLNIDPTSLSLDEQSRDQAILVLLHEMTHLFGYSWEKFSQFVDPSDGVTPVPLSDVVFTETLQDNRTITKIKTPKVLATVQAHFGCDSLNGVELEDGGGNGTALSHWEQRVYFSEYMTGSFSEREVSIFSYITLSLLEDSGWYEIDYSLAAPPKWGYKKGCNFLEPGSCSSWPKMYGGCKSDSINSCNFDRQSKSFCGFSTDLNITESYYIYYGSVKLGGFDHLADYCPYYVAYTNGVCSDPNNVLPTSSDRGELFELQSKCFQGTISRIDGASSQMNCYGTRCITDTDLKVAVDYSSDDFSTLFGQESLPVTRIWYDCPYGKSISVFGYSGQIACPSLNEPACLGGNEPDWPLITSVSPSSGSEGTTITIEGSNFNQTLVIFIGDTQSICEVVSDSKITCTLGNSANLKGKNVPIFIADPDNDRSSVAPYEAFQYASASKLVNQWTVIGMLVYSLFVLL